MKCVIIFVIPYLIYKIKHNLHILQQNFYNENNRYLKWSIKNITKVFSILEIILLIINGFNLIWQNKYLLLINILYLGLFLNKISKKEQVKIPLKITSRIKRLIITITIIYLGFLSLLIWFNEYLITFIFLCLVNFSYYLVYLANIINKPLEKITFNFYKRKALLKLKSFSSMPVIGITGSYGKTSSKNILNTILSVKYNTLATPKNYNTLYGLIMTINNYLDKFTDLFIAEMGAFKRGSIKKLCNLVKPKYGIITTIGKAHLDTFKSVENIRKGKFELFESLPNDGVCILNLDDPYQKSYDISSKCPVIWIGIENKEANVYAKDISMSKEGMNFKIVFNQTKEEMSVTTKILGKANIYNILAGVALGKHLNMSNEEIKRGVANIKPFEHRLELKKINNRYIIDDAYNSNPVGAKMALEVLALMPGKRVVVTPGMIELGPEQEELNYEFGQNIAKVADYVILVGEKQTKAIKRALEDSKYKLEQIKVINDVKEAFLIIDKLDYKEETYILLENDLPDIFNEEM